VNTDLSRVSIVRVHNYFHLVLVIIKEVFQVGRADVTIFREGSLTRRVKRIWNCPLLISDDMLR